MVSMGELSNSRASQGVRGSCSGGGSGDGRDSGRVGTGKVSVGRGRWGETVRGGRGSRCAECSAGADSLLLGSEEL